MTQKNSTSGRALPPTLSDLPPRYQKHQSTQLSGGYGVIEQVRDTFLDRIVVYKSMQDSEDNDQLLTEIRAIAKARSRHVVEIYDVVFNERGHVSGIIIEHLSGSDYSTFYQTCSSDLPKYLRVLYQIATALKDMHAVGVVHRDLKLANMRDAASGILKVFDFGLSATDSKYATTNNRGTYIYAAPELYKKGAVITPEMDIYAFGVCAWTLAVATNKLPKELLESPPQNSGRAPSIAQVLPHLPVDIVAKLDACLDPDHSKRPAAKAISKLLSHHLLHGQHRGLLVLNNGGTHEISETRNNANVKVQSCGEIRITYDGLSFSVDSVTGNVFRNNEVVVAGTKLTGACLFTFGTANLEYNRTWIPFFPSHPEVIL